MTWNLVGNEWATDMLRRHLAQNELRHAYLFAGPPGVGRRTLALQLARAINCQKPPAPGEFCGECRTCRQIERMQYADLTIIRRPEDKTRIVIDQIRELQRSVMLSPFEGKMRVGLLLKFEEANDQAQNALLKTLEEAPSKVVLLLTADSEESLLPTIVSRCEVLRLRPMAVHSLEAELASRWNIPADEARLLAHLSGGRVGTALDLHEHPEQMERRRTWQEDALNLLEAPYRDRLKYSESINPKPVDREKLRLILSAWLSMWRDLMLASSGANIPLVNLDLEADLMRVARRVGTPAARACTAALEKSLAGLDANLNTQLLTDTILLDWPKV